jgi:hypothetical protein
MSATLSARAIFMCCEVSFITPSFVWGSWNIAAFVPGATKRFQLEFEYVEAL